MGQRDDHESDDQVFPDDLPGPRPLRSRELVAEDGEHAQAPDDRHADRGGQGKEEHGHEKRQGHEQLREKGRARRYPYFHGGMDIFGFFRDMNAERIRERVRNRNGENAADHGEERMRS